MTDFQLFDALPTHIEDALRESIRRFGVIVPVVVDQDGRIIDGHHRSRIADELGEDYDTSVIYCEDDEQAREIARTLNADRRHLTPEQRREVVTHLREMGHSTTAIAEAVGVNQSTVSRDLQAMQPHNPPAEVRGTDGKTYPASRPSPEPMSRADAEALTEKIRDKIVELDTLIDGEPEREPTARERNRAEVAVILNGTEEEREQAGQRMIRRRFTEALGRAISDVHATLIPGPEQVFDRWSSEDNPRREAPGQDELWSADGIRTVAKLLTEFADVIDEHMGGRL